jgi:hypothetical protein
LNSTLEDFVAEKLDEQKDLLEDMSHILESSTTSEDINHYDCNDAIFDHMGLPIEDFENWEKLNMKEMNIEEYEESWDRLMEESINAKDRVKELVRFYFRYVVHNPLIGIPVCLMFWFPALFLIFGAYFLASVFDLVYQ